MSRIRKLATAAGTFSLALGIGFVMQNGDVLAARFGPAPVAPQEQGPVVLTPADPMAMPVLPAVRPVAARISTMETIALPSEVAVPVLALFEADAADPLPEAPEAISDSLASGDCTTTLTAETLPAGLVSVHLSAPCAPLARVSFHHRGLSFSELTDADGVIDVVIPALAEQAVILVDVPGSAGAAAMVDVPEVAGLDRAVLQWQGEAGLNLHALEYGADYGEAGHVWAEAPGDMASDRGGFVMELGDPAAPEPLLAQVYTFAHGNAERAGDVVLNIDAEVTATNCGRDLTAQSLQIAPGGEPVAHDLTLRMPDCDAVGELLVVSGMLSDLHLAAN